MLFGLSFTNTAAAAADQVLWRIGSVDYSTLEFNQDWNFATAGEPVFHPGLDNPLTGWSAFHPGSSEESAGNRPHPFTIRFDLKNSPSGVFNLKIHLLIKSSGIPQYIVDINGKKGRFLLHPQLSREIGDPATAWNILFSCQTLSIELPAVDFHVGANELVLACVGGNYAPVLGSEAQSLPHSGVYYDELELSNDPNKEWTPARQLIASPTMFYRSGPSGLREIILLRASDSHAVPRGIVTLHLTGATYPCKLDSTYDFGDAECGVEVPEFSTVENARLTFSSQARTEHADVTLTPVRKWTLFLAPLVHLDMGYTDYRADSYEVHARNVDGIVDALEQNRDYKYNPDGAFILADYFAHRSPSQQARATALLREKRLSLPAQLFTVNTGLASSEELFRLFYTSGNFGRIHNVPIEYANQTDVPAHVWAVPSYLNAIGVRHFAISSNPFRGAMIPNGRMNARAPFWWEGPDGARVLTSFSRQYTQYEQLFTTANSVSSGIDSLPIFLQTYSEPSYVPDAVLLYGTQNDNRPFLPAELDFPAVWNHEFAFPKLQAATFEDYFEYVERKFGSSLPILRGDGGAWWEEMAASDARFAAIARNAKERVLGAEKLASLANAINPSIPFPLGLDSSIWENLLFYTEHTWGAAATWKRPESDQALVLRSNKESFPQDAARQIDDMMHRALSQIGDKLNVRGPTLAVVNTLSWSRSGEIEADIDRGKDLIDPRSGVRIPLERVRRVPDEEYDRVRFEARDVPPLGYRCYSIAAGSGAAPAKALPVTNTIENAYYRVVVDASRGSIVGIYDKELNRELVDRKSSYGVNEYVYAGYSYPGESLIHQREARNSSLLQLSPALPYAHLTISTPTRGKVASVERIVGGMRMVMVSSAAHTPSIITEIKLFDRVKKIQIFNRVQKDAVKAPEGVYFAFPFKVAPAAFRYETQNAWVDPAHDQLPGANKEWFVAQHWVSVSAPDISIGLTLGEAPLFTIGDIVRGKWPLTFEPHNSTIFSYVMNNYDGDDERPFQDGQFTFHYSISSSRNFDAATLSRFSHEEVNPLEIDQITTADKLIWNEEPLSGESSGFVDIDRPDVQLMTWKGAEDGQGAILRFQNLSENAVTAYARFPHLRFDSVSWTSGIERDTGHADFADDRIVLSLKPHEIRTVRVLGLSRH